MGKKGECVLVFPPPKVMNQLKLSKLTGSFRIIVSEEEYQKLKKELEDSLNVPEPLEEEEEQEELTEEEDNGQEKLIYNGMPEPSIPSDDDFTFEE